MSQDLPVFLSLLQKRETTEKALELLRITWKDRGIRCRDSHPNPQILARVPPAQCSVPRARREPHGLAFRAQSGRAFQLSHRPGAGGAGRGGAWRTEKKRVGARPAWELKPHPWLRASLPIGEPGNGTANHSKLRSAVETNLKQRRRPLLPGNSPSRAHPLELLGVFGPGHWTGGAGRNLGQGALVQPISAAWEGTMGNDRREIGVQATFSSL